MQRLKLKLYVSLGLALLTAAALRFYYAYPDLSRNPVVKNKDYVQAFLRVYATNEWEAGSGPGSNPKYAQPYIEVLQRYIDTPFINSIVDLGCGDWQIMQHINLPAKKTYKGYDVVPHIVDKNIAEFTRQNVRFYHVTSVHDFAQQKVSGDLLVVKDVLQHWPLEDIQYFIDYILPNFKFALITNTYTVHDRKHNKDIHVGGFRSLDLVSKPFNLKDAHLVLDYFGPEHKHVLLYENPHKQLMG